MYYKVNRASYKEPPCEEAVLKKFPIIDNRISKTPEEFDQRFGQGSWLSHGTNHKIIPGKGISRVVGTSQHWVVKISNLKQLQSFIKKYGKVIINEDCITIYDDYIE